MKRKSTTTNSLSTTKLIPETVATGSEFYLPDDCWELICTFLGDNNDRYLEYLSLASKQILSITNRLRSSFTISNRTLPFIPTLFNRFPNLTSLHITSNFQGDLDALLCQISKFPFKIKSLKLSDHSTFPEKGLRALSRKITTLTSLTCSNIFFLSKNHCVLISDCFPLLEELHLHRSSLSFHSIQIGVEVMLIALPKLRKINLSGHGFDNINFDSLLLHLCNNCEFLEEVGISTLVFLTSDGIASAIRQRPTLRSLSFEWNSTNIHDIISSQFIDSLVSLKGLTCLHLLRKNISDELLSSIAMGDLPLRRLVLRRCTGYSYAGIFPLLSKCQHIRHLDLQNANFLNDHHIVTLSSFLADLVTINLSNCWSLTDLALFALLGKCSSLSDIQMEHTRMGENIVENYNYLMNFGLNPPLKSLYLASSSLLKDVGLLIFATFLTNLQLLDLSHCNYISEEGICQVLRRCCKIRHLNLTGWCNAVKLNILNFQVPKLEVLNLSHTTVDDEALYAISKNCRGLLQLLLECCNSVTKHGVKHVVENCTQLREINLAHCYKVCADIVDDMVHSRPSLRKIIAPPTYRLSDKKRKLFWNRGCHVFCP